ncbi:MAG: hypothetical protein COW66_13065 [Flavobacteriaceae bacterium CG18_big_fil_WC_8_21_14_2_50_34_36]|nr:tyrosine-type recombinase/integrase [Flavobacteriia bacterium]NCT18046.1 tyrosine-type recombinase/integrase [Flavobacteriia bacterium]PIQ17197.1 MAG: hypothetical protein COW66_13065 [Flavobacteriaceae bacterium CG18_big_fil_WC_8_21_14_2_50_34_36]PJC08209.1 MAG: hypothetical protein CO068_02170 [Flavobacteriaceae bacterium CG_4_9_14_0_8_um_filter_34_30]
MNIELLLEDFCYYAKHIRGVSQDTVKRYHQKVSYFIKVSEISRIDEITEKMVHSFFIYGRAHKKWKTSSYRTYYMSILVFFRWCVKNKYLEHNFLDDFELPKLEKSLPKKIKKEEALRLLEIAYNYPYTQKYLKYRNHAIFALFLFAGLRRNELLNLKFSDVDIENMSIFVRLGKGSKDRIIPMNHTLAQSLNRYLFHRKKNLKTCPEFFACSNRNKGLTQTGLKLITNKLKEASGISFTIHKLRHTFATLMLEGGCDIYSLSKMMGHSDIKTTTIYLSASAEHLRSQITKHPLNDLV